MKLLFVTQVVDENDSILGAYHGWITELASHMENIEVICLQEGKHQLPSNVRVHSLGKEKGKRSKLIYALRFKKLAWRLRQDYDAVFVHMNQEYIFIAGPLWKLMGKRIYMWRNHYAGSLLTDIAMQFCTNVFCTSKHSYTAKYKKTILMPVGINTTTFSPDGNSHKSDSILFLSRMAPSKRPEILIDALDLLDKEHIEFSASFYGDPLSKDTSYYQLLLAKTLARKLTDHVHFYGSLPNIKTPEVYRSHEIFVNCSQSGMFDKTLFEAAACGCLVLASSEDFRVLAGDTFYFDGTIVDLKKKLSSLLALPSQEINTYRSKLIEIAREQNISRLMEKMSESLQSPKI